MKHNLLHPDTGLPSFISGGFWHAFKIASLSILVLVLILGSGTYVWARGYEDKIPPNVFIADIDFGGLRADQASLILQDKIDEILTNGIEISVGEEDKTLSLVTLVSSDLIEDVVYELDGALEEAMSVHQTNSTLDSFAMIKSLVRRREVTLGVSVNKDQVQENLLALFPDSEKLSTNASYEITAAGDTFNINVSDGSAGTEFQWETFFVDLDEYLGRLDRNGLDLDLIDQEPRVATYEAATQIEDVIAVLEAAPFTFTISNEDETWELGAAELAEMIAPGEGLSPVIPDEVFAEWFNLIELEVNQDAQNARLEIENGRVVDFLESHEGRTVDKEISYELLMEQFVIAESLPIELPIEIEVPTVVTSDVNDLGINEILGTGTSSYRGSPSNRRGNIQNGVDLLDGLLIAPGDSLSLIDALSPFTYENGYLPELVIKGDKIIPELGGGLCQIGTTTFRATMNAGLEIVQRRNHSLVVSYYNDQTNGLPGTDATIYEPYPDYQFRNNTDNYILFQAENLTDTQELRFTFWGTTDGRQGSYDPPTVLRWIPVGETQYVETTELEPGVEKCQEAHIGADTSFTYSVIRPTGEVEETLFESHYRPLAKICLVGVEELSEEESDDEAEEDEVEESDEDESSDTVLDETTKSGT
jgi:vancomycin resistance protein YoaR